MAPRHANGSEALQKKFLFFEDFWKREGSYPILFAKPHFVKEKPYARHDLIEQHNDVNKLLEENLLVAEEALDLVDDGIPAIRANLGTTLLPSGMGLETALQPAMFPWLKEHLSVKQYLALTEHLDSSNISKNDVELALAFYALFFRRQQEKSINADILPYAPDTQGVFDLSHIILGNDLFMLLQDEPETVHQIQKRSMALFQAATQLFKQALGEANRSMLHGHGMKCGVWFPDTGLRISEDSCTLISGQMIDDFCLPYIKKAVEPFGRGFMHFCGKHEPFLERVCRMPEISTVNLGNPEMYDLDALFSLMGKTKTVYFGHFALFKEESAETYLERLAHYCGKHGAKLILISEYRPKDSDEKKKLVARWHELTNYKK